MEFPQRISELVLESSSQKFKTPDFLDLLRPSVYIFMKGTDVLYIGYSGCLLQRLGFQHHRATVMQESTEILLYPTRTEADAIELEELLIEHLKPTRNIRKRYTRRLRQLGMKTTANLQRFGIRVESPRGPRKNRIYVSSEETETLPESTNSDLTPTLA